MRCQKAFLGAGDTHSLDHDWDPHITSHVDGVNSGHSSALKRLS